MQASETTTPIRNYLTDVWETRFFWFSLVKLDLRNRYRRSILGVAWSLLQTLCLTLVLCFVFRRIFPVSVREYAPFLLCGLATWQFLTSVILEGANCFHAGEGYMRTQQIPKAIFPIRVSLGVGFHFAVSITVAIVLAWTFRGGASLGSLWMLPPIAALLLVFGWSVAVLMGIAAVHFPDSPHLASVVLQVLYFMTPVLYPPIVVESRGLGELLAWNPLSAFIEIVRTPILDGTIPAPAALAIGGLSTLALFVAAVVVLWRNERTLIYGL